MTRTAICFTIALLAQCAHAEEVELSISPPEPAWLMPPLICRSSSLPMPVCVDSDAVSPDALSYRPPIQLLPEGIPLPGEEQILLDIRPLIAAGDYEAVVARIKENLGPELALLEAGDSAGFVGTRVPTDGRSPPRPPPLPDRPRARPMETGDPPRRDEAQAAARSAFARSNVFANRLDVGVPTDVISASLLYVIGHSYFSLEQYLPAETAFKLALGPLPNHVRVHESLGMLYFRTERYADARVHLARALQLGRNTAHVHAALGYLEQKTRHYWAASKAFQRALVLEPSHRSARRGLLHALTETREHAKAKALVEQLLAEEPEDSSLWLYRAKIALATEQRAVALASLETALRLGEDSAVNRQVCAALQIENGNYARAVDLLRGSARGIAFPLVERTLGWLVNAAEWDDLRALLGSIDRTQLGVVEQSRLATHRASLDLHDGNRGAARTALEEALALDPANADALLALGQIYRAERNYGRAELLLARASAYDSVRASAAIARAGVAIEQETFDGAVAILRNAVALNPMNTDLRRNLDVLEDIVLLRTER